MYIIGIKIKDTDLNNNMSKNIIMVKKRTAHRQMKVAIAKEVHIIYAKFNHVWDVYTLYDESYKIKLKHIRKRTLT